MIVTFFSNYLNHHQMPLCREFLALDNVEYHFVATTPISKERLRMGYADMNMEPFVIRAYESEQTHLEALRLARESDIIIHGNSMPVYVQESQKSGKPFFRYNERFFKKLRLRSGWYTMLQFHLKHSGRKNKNTYMLCASAFTAADAAKIGAYKNKCYKWGYFPEVNIYPDIERIVAAKKPSSILWAGRMIDWKHPELPVLVAERLMKDGYDFSLNIIGTGKMEEEIKQMISYKGLDGKVKLLGSMPPEKVRQYMEESQIFLFTSNKEEGWGAVLNESMNSACAVVASHAIGSVPFLLSDGNNGMIYRSCDANDLYDKVKYLLENDKEAKKIGKEAYKTLTEQWNAKNAVMRFMRLAQQIIDGNKRPDIFPDGVCSKAPILKDNWR